MVAVLLDEEVGQDMILPDAQALLAKAGEKVEFKQPGREVAGLKIRDEIGVRIGKGEIAFADRHERRQMADRGRQQVEFRRCPARSGLHQKLAAPGPRRQGLRRIAGAHGNAETVERGLGGGIGAVFVDLDPAVIDTPAQGEAGEGPLLRIKKDTAARAAPSGPIGAEDMDGVEIGPAFERQRIEFELALADRCDQPRLIGWGHCRPHLPASG